MTAQVCLQTFWKSRCTLVKPRIKNIELALQRRGAELFGCLHTWARTAEPQLASLSKNLLLTSSSKETECLNG